MEQFARRSRRDREFVETTPKFNGVQRLPRVWWAFRPARRHLVGTRGHHWDLHNSGPSRSGRVTLKERSAHVRCAESSLGERTKRLGLKRLALAAAVAALPLLAG